MAVYTEVADAALAVFLQHYDLGSPVTLTAIAEGVENSNYLLVTTAGRFVLTLYEKRVDPDDLPYFLGLMRYLAAQGLSCPVPVPARDGEALRVLAGRPACVQTFLPGTWPRHIRLDHCAAVGAALAALHAAGADFDMRRTNGLGPAAWSPLFARCEARADEVRGGLRDEIRDALAAILQAWPSDLPAGQIHADLFPDNVFFVDGALSGLIDFYFACTDLLAYDVAVCLNAWCFEADGSLNVTKARALLGAYQAGRSLTGAERDALPVLCAGAAVRFLLTRLYDWLHRPPGAFVTPKDPIEYLRRLRFHRTARGPKAYGLE